MRHTVHPESIGAALQRAAEVHRGSAAYIDSGEIYSYDRMNEIVDRVACGLLALGLERGDRLGVVGLNQIAWLQLFFAAARIGVAIVALSVRHRADEVQVMLSDGNAKAVAALGQADGFDLIGLIEKLRPGLPSLRYVMRVDDGGPGVVDLAALARTPVNHERLDTARVAVMADDVAMVIYTSGTTGRPKGALLTHRTMLAAARSQAVHIKASSTDVLHLAMPFNHVGGITCEVLMMLLGGGCCELVPAFKAEVVLDMMVRNPPTLLMGVPTMLTLLLMNLAKIPVDMRSVRLVITGGANADDTLLNQLIENMPHATVMQLYGLSESSGALVMTPWDASREELIQSLGRVLPDVQVRVVDADGQDIAQGNVGELWFRSAGVVPGYIGGDAQADSLAAGGWLRTGDLGYIDSSGLIYLKGRSKDMYIQGGFNVYTAEVEGFIARHPKVLMVAGIGVPDPVLGEVGRYYVVPKPASGLTVDEIRAQCALHLADYKIPRQILLRDELPLTPAGKIHKAALRAETQPQGSAQK
ncbi:AMP-binding protein [Paraburkholderia metrosideri]|uniref:AMP-binding protein n=1 Tax=Paraburkholderia metrosideri TaxID=580937 RepID=A0ABW9E1B2_9BURK